MRSTTDFATAVVGAAAGCLWAATGRLWTAAGCLGAATAGTAVAATIVDLAAHAATAAASVSHAAAAQLGDSATNYNQCEDVSSRHDPVNSGLTTNDEVTRLRRCASVRRDLSASRFAANHKIVKLDSN